MEISKAKIFFNAGTTVPPVEKSNPMNYSGFTCFATGMARMMGWGSFTFLIFWVNITIVYGQTESCRKSTEGKEFWFGFMENRNYQSGHYTNITLTSVYDCNYSVYVGKSTIPIASGILNANNPIQVPIDWHLVEAIGSENIQDKAIHLVSDQPLNVYALNWAPNSADVAVIYPATSLGNEYFTMCYDPHLSSVNPATGTAQGKNSEFMIVAAHDNTTVWITPSKMTDQLKPANVPFMIVLSKGEVYQVQSENLPGTSPEQGDLTGSYINSDKPVAVFSGSYATTVPVNVNDAYDHLYEQIPPLQTWGRKFMAVPLLSRGKDTYRILAAENDTEVRVGTTTLTPLLQKGEYREFMLSASEVSLIESNKPVLLAQYSNSNIVDRPPGVPSSQWNGDPFMIIVSPVNQTREKVTFVAYESAQIKKYYLNVVVKNDAVGKINLDGLPVSFQSHPGSGYSYVQLEITKGNHNIVSTEPGKGFIAYVYGFGGYESYGYGVGFNLDIVLDLGSDINANGEKLVVRCEGEPPIILNAGNAFDDYKWSTGETTSTIQIENNGWYRVKVSTKDGCVLEDSVELQVSIPMVALGRDTTICNPASLVLDAGDQFTEFLWSTAQTDQKITVTQPGDYAVVVTNKFGCKASDELKVSFTERPKIDFSRLDTLICGKTSTLLDIKADKGVFTIERMSDNFLVEGLNVNVPDFGTFPLKIIATDEFSCVSDSLISFGFHKTPTVNFSVDSTKCYGYNLHVKYSGDANIDASDFTWIYGGDTITQGIGQDDYIIPLGINRAARDLSLTVIDQGCRNEKSLHNIKVIPNLQMWAEDTSGCEPFTAKFMATNTETVAYNWDFGDGDVLSGSTADPVHTYQNDGYYPVKLKVVTSQGCTNETRIDSMIQVAPVPTVGFTSFSAECLQKGNQEISYLGSGDAQDTYRWDLAGFNLEEIVQNPGNGAGPFIFNLKNRPQANIKLSVTSKYGCKSDTAMVLVKRKPAFSLISSSQAGCTPFEPVFTATTGDPIDQVSYSWDFGDDTQGSGDQIPHTYEVPDRQYNLVMTAISALTGCTDTMNRPSFITTHPKPVAAFEMDHTIVYNDEPTVNFLNLSTGAVSWLWDFGDDSTSDSKDPSHYYIFTGYRNVLLRSVNEFQCIDTVSHKVLVAFDRIFPPTGFSPNAPNGVDREFKLASEGVSTEGYHLTILSRWNDLVFEARDEIKGWNGQMPNGSFAPAGSYVWVLNFTDYLGRRHRQTGTVTLVY